MILPSEESIKLRQAKPFAIDAGNFYYDHDYGETAKNYKYCDRFATLHELMEAFKRSKGYAFRELTYIDPKGIVHNITIYDNVVYVKDNNHE